MTDRIITDPQRASGPLFRALLVVSLIVSQTAASARGGPAPPETAWHEVITPHITLISNGTPELTESYAGMLEQFRFYLPTVAPELTVHPDAPPLYVFVFDAGGEYSPLRNCSSCTGLFVQSPYGNYIAVETDRRSRVQDRIRYLYHEFVHYVVRNRAVAEDQRYYPPWLEEGMAELFSSLSVDKGVIRVGVLRDDAWLLDFDRPLPVESVFKRRDVPHRGRDGARFYNHAWVLYRYFRSGQQRQRQLDTYIRHLNNGYEIDEAFRASFNTDYGGFGERLKTYFALVERAYDQPKFMYRYYNPPHQYRPSTNRTRELTQAEAAYRLGALLFQAAGVKPASARDLFKTAIDTSPGLHLGYFGLARYYMEKDRPVRAQFHLNRALERAPDDPQLLALHGDILLMRAAEAHNRYNRAWRGLADRAHAQYLRALRHDDGNPAALLGLGYYHALFSSRGEEAAIAEGIDALDRVRHILPNPIVDLMLGQLESRRDRTGRARQHLKRAKTWSTNETVLSRAGRMLKNLDDDA